MVHEVLSYRYCLVICRIAFQDSLHLSEKTTLFMVRHLWDGMAITGEWPCKLSTRVVADLLLFDAKLVKELAGVWPVLFPECAKGRIASMPTNLNISRVTTDVRLSLKHGDVEAFSSEGERTGEPRRSGTDNDNMLPLGEVESVVERR
eukprot:scaffold48951_cov74-Phaeocystis_antarctica.AAC.1